MANATTGLPLAALDDRLAFVGTTGSGKTYNAGGAVERLLDKRHRVVIVDPLDVWWGLRLQPDGRQASPYDVAIFGGAHGDLPLNEHAGGLIGETVATMRESAIVSLGGLVGKASERRFMLAFLTALYRHLKGELLHLVIDEADMFAPQRLLDKEGEAAKLLGMMETVVRRGRIKGFIPWLITQRPAVLSKDVLSQADGLIAFKLTSSQDRAAIGAWIEGQADQAEGKAILASLPGMQRGQGVVWVPGRSILETVQFPIKRTFDSSRTPRRGETVRATSLKPLDLGALRAKLATVEADAKANDPAALKKRIRELEAAQSKPAPAIDKAKIEADRKAAYEAGYLKGAKEARTKAFREAQDAVRAAAAIEAPAPFVPAPAPTPPARTMPAATLPQPTTGLATTGTLGAERRILNVLATRHPARLSEAQWATLSAMKRTGGTWSTYKSRLRSAGYIEQGSDRLWHVTEAGFDAIGGRPEPAGSVIDTWLKALGGERRMLEHLIAVYPGRLSREDLAARLDMAASGGTFNTYLSRLRSNNLADSDRDGVKASDDLME